MQHTLYHSLLRMISLTVALVLVFESGLINPVTKELSQNTHTYIATAIGMYAGVESTALNTITADLTRRETELAAREAEVTEREIAVGLNAGTGSGDNSVYILSSILFVLLVLIILNYILDFWRQKQARRSGHEAVV